MAEKNTSSQIISYLAHPIFIPLLGVLAIVNFHWVSASKYTGSFLQSLITILFLTTICIPIFALGSMFQKYRPSDFQDFSRKERSLGAWVMTLVYLILLYLMPLLYQDRMIRYFLLATAISTAVGGLVNWRYKISYHTMAWAGLIALLFVLNNQSFIDLFLIILATVLWTGMVSYARLKEGAHTPGQIYTGFFLGLLVNASVYLFAYGF